MEEVQNVTCAERYYTEENAGEGRLSYKHVFGVDSFATANDIPIEIAGLILVTMRSFAGTCNLLLCLTF